MSWDYDLTELPSALTSGLTDATTEQKKNFIRFLIGDVQTTRQLTSDEAIFAAMSTEDNPYTAAARCVLAIVQDVLSGGIEDQKVGETRIRMKRADELKSLADDLRARGGTNQTPSAGGILLADRKALEENSNILQPAITKGMHDINLTGNQPGGRRDVGGNDD